LHVSNPLAVNQNIKFSTNCDMYRLARNIS